MGVVQLKRGVDLAAALDGLLVELVGAALSTVEGGLKAVAHVKNQIDGADGVRVGGEALAVAVCSKVDHGGSGGKDTPVNGVGEGLLLREAVTGARRRERGYLLPVSHGGQCEEAKDRCCLRARLHSRAWLLWMG